MKRNVPGLSETAHDSHSEVLDGIFLVRLDGAQHGWQAQKRFCLLPGSSISSSAYPKPSGFQEYRPTAALISKVGPLRSSMEPFVVDTIAMLLVTDPSKAFSVAVRGWLAAWNLALDFRQNRSKLCAHYRHRIGALNESCTGSG
jgi:hypothetical protein